MNAFMLVTAAVVLVAPSAQARPTRAVQAQKARPAALTSPGSPAADAMQQRVREASVFLPSRACTGVVVGSARVIATAAHCLVPGRKTTPVELSDGSRVSARVAHVDLDRDVALLVTEESSSVAPLSLASGMPRAGSQLLFLGRPDRARARIASVTRLGPCPSLPKLPAAAFTTLSAVPGDSGAPLVDDTGRVVALVHGGARCHIAVPVQPLTAAFRKLSADVRSAQPAQRAVPTAPLDEADSPGAAQAQSADGPPTADAADAPGGSQAADSDSKRKERFGPFLVERTKKGFRFSFSFSFGTRPKP
jgi:S1-C subfamily serine protease